MRMPAFFLMSLLMSSAFACSPLQHRNRSGHVREMCTACMVGIVSRSASDVAERMWFGWVSGSDFMSGRVQL